MEVTTKIYKIYESPKLSPDYPYELQSSLYEDFAQLSQLMGLEPSNFGFSKYKDYLEVNPKANSNGVPDSPLTQEIISRLRDFSRIVSNVDLDPEDLNDRYFSTPYILIHLFDVRQVLEEQFDYFDPESFQCPGEIYFIVSFINSIPYGGTFIFHNPEQDYVYMQGIAKFFIPALFSLLVPENTLPKIWAEPRSSTRDLGDEQSAQVPKLNSLLQPSIESLAKDLGVSKIYVSPIGKQGDILEKYYGYQRTEMAPFPCYIIRNSLIATLQNGKGFPFYSKDLSQNHEDIQI